MASSVGIGIQPPATKWCGSYCSVDFRASRHHFPKSCNAMVLASGALSANDEAFWRIQHVALRAQFGIESWWSPLRLKWSELACKSCRFLVDSAVSVATNTQMSPDGAADVAGGGGDLRARRVPWSLECFKLGGKHWHPCSAVYLMELVCTVHGFASRASYMASRCTASCSRGPRSQPHSSHPTRQVATPCLPSAQSTAWSEQSQMYHGVADQCLVVRRVSARTPTSAASSRSPMGHQASTAHAEENVP